MAYNWIRYNRNTQYIKTENGKNCLIKIDFVESPSDGSVGTYMIQYCGLSESKQGSRVDFEPIKEAAILRFEKYLSDYGLKINTGLTKKDAELNPDEWKIVECHVPLIKIKKDDMRHVSQVNTGKAVICLTYKDAIAITKMIDDFNTIVDTMEMVINTKKRLCVPSRGNPENNTDQYVFIHDLSKCGHLRFNYPVKGQL